MQYDGKLPENMPDIDIDALDKKINEIWDAKKAQGIIPNSEEVDEFLSKIETVNQQVKDIVSGKMTLDEVD
jgi:hypothetical protein